MMLLPFSSLKVCLTPFVPSQIYHTHSCSHSNHQASSCVNRSSKSSHPYSYRHLFYSHSAGAARDRYSHHIEYPKSRWWDRRRNTKRDRRRDKAAGDKAGSRKHVPSNCYELCNHGLGTVRRRLSQEQKAETIFDEEYGNCYPFRKSRVVKSGQQMTIVSEDCGHERHNAHKAIYPDMHSKLRILDSENRSSGPQNPDIRSNELSPRCRVLHHRSCSPPPFS